MRSRATRTFRLIPLVAMCLLSVQYASAQSSDIPAQSAQQIAANVDEYMKAAVRVKHFSGSVFVARDGQPLISEGYGMANCELDVPNTPQTIFRLGSITKPFTAVAIMMLQERGRLNVNDSVCKYLSDCPAAWQPVTIRHLLTHTSGIPTYVASPEAGMFPRTLPVTHEGMLERFMSKPLEFTPGEKGRYSNAGYYLLGVIIERTSGKSYEDFLQENIFKPLELRNTGYDSSSRVIKNRAAGYVMRNDMLVNASYIDMSIPYAGGALYSTTEDLLRWEQALYTEKLLSRKSLDELFTPFKEIFPGIAYAYGWGVTKQLDRQALMHAGDIHGFSAFIARFPADRMTIIVLGNNISAAAQPIAKDLSAIAFGAPYKLPEERQAIALDAGTLEEFVGQYQVASSSLFPPNSVITITAENGKLMAQLNEDPKAELFAQSETEFFLKVADVQITFVVDTQGRATGLTLHRTGLDIPASKVK